MKLYLVQHGDAVPKEIDADRPLSEQGRRDVEGIGSLMRNGGIRVSRIEHSGKTRAQQTAEILSAALQDEDAIESVEGLGPNDSIEPWAGAVDGRAEDTMLVGHLPFMGKLVSRLVAGDESADIVRFVPGSVVCLEQDGGSGWVLAWMLRPELVHG